MVLLGLRGSSACPRCVDISRTASRPCNPAGVDFACVERPGTVRVLEGMVRFPLLWELAQI